MKTKWTLVYYQKQWWREENKRVVGREAKTLWASTQDNAITVLLRTVPNVVDTKPILVFRAVGIESSAMSVTEFKFDKPRKGKWRQV